MKVDRKKAGFGLVVGGLLALIGSFLPILHAGDYYVSVTNIRGVTTLMYFLPLLLIILGTLSIYKKFSYQKIWGIGICLLGFILLVWTVYLGKNHLIFVVQSIENFNERQMAFKKEFEERWQNFDRKFHGKLRDSNTLSSQEKEISSQPTEVETSDSNIPRRAIGLGTILLFLGFANGLFVSLFLSEEE